MNVTISKIGRALGVTALGLGLLGSAGCDKAAEQCGFKCATAGVAEGNASISGVLAIDAFFGSVVNFDKTSSSVAAGIQAELEGIRADFGIAADADLEAELKAQFAANLEGGIKVKAEPARCAVDAKASLEAQASCQADAKCDVMVDPGSAMVECSGGCEVEASAMASCSAEADLKCTVTAPSVACEGECKGSCEIDASAGVACEGSCEGTCEGTCSAKADANGDGTVADGECGGKCDGMCTGTCKAELEVSGSCSGTCKGECTVTNPEGGCEGGVRASCEAKADAKVMCEGRCDGEVTPPSASADCEASASCEASAKADASINVQCTPPSVQIDYELKASASGDVMAQARFEAGLKNLKVRLPALLASLKKATLVVKAGEGLVASAEGAVKGAAKAVGEGEIDLAAGFKLVECVPDQLAAVGGVIEGGTSRLSAQVSAAGGVTAAVGL